MRALNAAMTLGVASVEPSSRQSSVQSPCVCAA